MGWQYFWVFVGGGLGCMTRFFMYQVTAPAAHQFPTSTLIINITGSLLIGFIFVLILEKFQNYAPLLQTVLMVGFLGGYTTFSAFALETLTLFENGQLVKTFSYVILSVVGCVLAAWLGTVLARMVTHV